MAIENMLQAFAHSPAGDDPTGGRATTLGFTTDPSSENYPGGVEAILTEAARAAAKAAGESIGSAVEKTSTGQAVTGYFSQRWWNQNWYIVVGAVVLLFFIGRWSK